MESLNEIGRDFWFIWCEDFSGKQKRFGDLQKRGMRGRG